MAMRDGKREVQVRVLVFFSFNVFVLKLHLDFRVNSASFLERTKKSLSNERRIRLTVDSMSYRTKYKEIVAL